MLSMREAPGSQSGGSPGHAEAEPHADSASRKARRVLVVEDNVDLANSLAELIELWGHEVTVAYTGPAGVERARCYLPDVVIMDIGLPVIDGYQAARLLRADLATRRIRLIALTGYGLDEDRRKAREAGFDLHLTKPADLDELKRALSLGDSER